MLTINQYSGTIKFQSYDWKSEINFDLILSEMIPDFSLCDLNHDGGAEQ